ncbi:MAG TPA: sigma-54 dependent transcriptional regulator [Longimicrobiales bacterium]|nr:sigma-54 dependent transcriptional regulator [Longimicrobiales bacterium]
MTPDRGRVLISTHDLRRAGALRDGFAAAGYATDLVTPGESLADDERSVLLILTGLEPDAEGQREGDGDLARQARERLHIPVFVIVTGETPTPAPRPGFDEVFGASDSVADVVLLGRRVIERRRLREITGIIGETDAVLQVLERVVQIAPVHSTVLVTGESGTGKELVARGIHALSPRKHEPFIAVNVAALSETLLESELFGHEKGAFTGAIDSRRGLFELANGGTIFLDEIGEMPVTTQTKLLRVLEQREFHRVGGEKVVRVDVRVIAATNQDLRQLVAMGEFRRDLFFRLNVLSIELPPLRERRADIPVLVESFVREASERHDRRFPGISPEAMQMLESYQWPGNIRELRNLVESMVVLAPGRVIRPEDIPDEVRRGRGSSLLPVPIRRESGEGASVPSLRPELEFVFRTLVDLRVDMDELRREFEAYRSEAGAHYDAATVIGRVEAEEGGRRAIELGPGTSVSFDELDNEETPHEPTAEEPPPEAGSPGRVVFEPGMTIEEMERRAIQAALAEVHGNRRKAAELLGIGERTLYRKISKYELDV